MLKKICLIFPRVSYKTGDPPLGLCSIAAYMRARLPVHVSIYDMTFTPSFSALEDYLNIEQPDLVGIYFATSMYGTGVKVAKLAKKSGAIVVAGGPHASILPETLLSIVDIVVVGEGEETMVELVEHLPRRDLERIAGIYYCDQDGIHITAPRTPLASLDAHAFPAFDLVDMGTYFKYWHYFDAIDPHICGMNIMASRGCPFRCSYCQPTLTNIFGATLRLKTPTYVVAEMKHYHEVYGITHFFFHDDTFGVDRAWADIFFNALIEINMSIEWGCNSRISNIDESFLRKGYQAGLRCVHFGIECGSQRVVDDIYQKGIVLKHAQDVVNMAKKIGLYVGGFFMLGAPGETRQEVEKTIRFACSLMLDEASFSIATPIPGTYLFNTMQEDGRYTVSNNFDDFDYYNHLAYAGGIFTEHELACIQKRALILFYIHPYRWKYVYKQILSWSGMVKLYHKIKRFCATLPKEKTMK